MALEPAALATLVPRLVIDLLSEASGSGSVHRTVEGSLLSADISGFTSLTELLAERGREGAEIITSVVNSCLTDLIAASEHYGGDVVKFGGDAVLVYFDGPGHERRAMYAGREMQYALRGNSHARRHHLTMTVGVSDGPFHAMVIGRAQRDVLLCGRLVTRTLRLEDQAEQGEVVVAETMAPFVASESAGGGLIIHVDLEHQAEPPPYADPDLVGSLITPSLLDYYSDYAHLGAEHRQVACGFVSVGDVDDHIDVYGGPATAEHLSDLFGQILDVLEAAGITLLHSDMGFGGFKLFIGGGVPASTDDPAGALVHAALAIAAIDSPFSVRLGLNVGQVFAGFLGAPHRRTFTVMGDVVNTAARMLGAADPGDVIAVKTIIDRARARVVGDELAPLMVKGKAEPVAAMRVRSLEQTGGKAGVPHVEFVGRSHEMKQLVRAMECGAGAAIVGPAGAGKTRLTTETIGPVDSIGSAGSAYMAATPYGAFWFSMRSLLGIDQQLSPPDAGAAVRAWLADNHPKLEPYAALLALVVGGEAPESPEVAAVEPAFRREVLHDSIDRLLSEHEPQIAAIVVEDTQWLDDASTELCGYLRAVAPARGWVVVRSMRPEAADCVDAGEPDAPGAAGGSEVRIELGPLPDDAIASIISQASERQLVEHEISRLVERANGNPLFALELARAVGHRHEEIPASIEEVVIARIDELPARARQAVRLASVLGARFAPETFTALVDTSGHDIERDVAAIREIFETDAEGFVRFRQLLYQEVAHSSLPFSQRKRLHQMVGAHLEEAVADLDSMSALLSYHFHSAADRRRCWKYSIQAAERAQRQHSPRDAITLYRRALDLQPLGLSRTERSDALAGFGRALFDAGSLEEAYAAFGRARRLAEARQRKLELQIEQASCRNQQAQYRKAMRTYASVLRAEATPPRLRAQAMVGRSSVLYRLGRNRECYARAKEAGEIAEQHGFMDVAARAWQEMGAAGEAIEADDFLDAMHRALEIFEETGNLSGAAEILNNLGVVAQLQGDLDEAADAYRRSLVLKQRVGDLSGAALVRMNLGEVELDRGSTDGVAGLLRSCLASFEQTGFTVGAAYTQGLLGRCALLEGRPEEARERLEIASRDFLQLGAEGYSADMDLLLIEVVLALGDRDDARRLLTLSRLRLDRDVFDNPGSAARRLAKFDRLFDASAP